MPGSPDSNNGNLTSKTDGTDTFDYLWDDRNRLVGVELNSSPVVSYEYDSKSRLLQRIEGGTTTNYRWKGWSLIKEVKTGTISETTDYLLPAGAFERGGNWYYMHGDALSSTQLVTDENGAQVGRFIYGAWGEELYASESVPGVLENRFVGGFGCRKDAATGLIYMRYRWYEPTLMRFISRDPIGMKGGTNFYKYAGNNPANNVDAMGLKVSDTPFHDDYGTSTHWNNDPADANLRVKAPDPLPKVSVTDVVVVEVITPVEADPVNSGTVTASSIYRRDCYPPNNPDLKKKLAISTGTAAESAGKPNNWSDLEQVSPWDTENPEFSAFQFGANGRAMGISLDELLNWEGSRNVGSDDAQRNIRRGYYYEEGVIRAISSGQYK